MTPSKKYRDAKRNAGLCVECGVGVTTTESVTCEICRIRIRTYRQKLMAEQSAKGLCKYSCCRNKPRAGRCYCEKHFTQIYTATRARFITNKENGWCRRCSPGMLPVPGRTLCQYHLEQNAANGRARYHRKKRKEK